MYRALYRKYRPQTFDDVIGQEAVVTTLKNQIATGKTSHAYLFTGSRGTGKTTCSKILAKAINCDYTKDGNPCGECEICRGIEEDSILDVVEMDAASNNGVDNIRLLKEEAFFVPGSCKKRVYIIDEAHMLTIPAFNALLKILEEPPEHVVFILATTEVHKIPVTIRSRCQRFDFKRITADDIAARIKWIAQREQIDIEDEAALLMAKLADGGMRDALSLLDKCASLGEKITLPLVKDMCGVADTDHIFQLVDSIVDRDIQKAMEIISQLFQNSVNMASVADQLLSNFRNIMLCKVMSDFEKLVPCTSEEKQRYISQAARIQNDDMMEKVRILIQGVGEVQRSAEPRISLEMLVLKLMQAASGYQPQVVQSDVPPLKAEVKPAVNKPKEPLVKAEVEENAQLQPLKEWQSVLTILEDTNKMVYSALIGSRAFIQGNIVLVDSQNSMFLTLMRNNQKTKNDLRSAIAQVTGKQYRLGPYKAENVVKTPTNPVDALAAAARANGIHVTEEGE